jgi:hypothetical protein
VIPEKYKFEGQVKFISLNVSSSTTLWELYDIAAKHFDKSPLEIQLFRTTGNKRELLDEPFISTLAELKFQDNEEIEVQKKFKSIKKAQLYSALTSDLTQ